MAPVFPLGLTGQNDKDTREGRGGHSGSIRWKRQRPASAAALGKPKSPRVRVPVVPDKEIGCLGQGGPMPGFACFGS